MITRNDVAKQAQVSVATVSRAFSGNGYVSDEKKAKVMAVAKDLGYQPNPVAISLKKNKTHQLLYYVRDLSNYFYLEMYKGMMAYARSNDYMVVISGDLDYQQIGSLMVDGIILPTLYFDSPQYTGMLRVPIVTICHGQISSSRSNGKVIVDSAEAIDAAVQYLKSKGHDKIAFASLLKGEWDEPRVSQFQRLMQPRYGNLLQTYIFGPESFEENTEEINFYELGMMCAKEFIETKCDATAILCFNDATAMGFINHIQSCGLKVPQDVSVMGIDGQAMGAYTSPSLTTVSMSPYQHGVECAKVLIGLIEGEEIVPNSMEIAIVERESVRRI